MANVAQVLLPVMDGIRGIADKLLGLRPFTVTIRTVAWAVNTGPVSQAGLGQTTVTDVRLLVGSLTAPGNPGGSGTANPKVRQLTDQEVIASQGLYKMEDMKVGPLTPPYVLANGTAGGMSYPSLDPPLNPPNPIEVYFKLTHAAYPSAGVWYVKVKQDVSSTLSTYLVLRRSPIQNPGGVP
jgi:hypothetical protein